MALARFDGRRRGYHSVSCHGCKTELKRWIHHNVAQKGPKHGQTYLRWHGSWKHNNTLWWTNMAAMKSPIFNRRYIFKRSIFYCHVSLLEGNSPIFLWGREVVIEKVLLFLHGDLWQIRIGANANRGQNLSKNDELTWVDHSLFRQDGFKDAFCFVSTGDD